MRIELRDHALTLEAPGIRLAGLSPEVRYRRSLERIAWRARLEQVGDTFVAHDPQALSLRLTAHMAGDALVLHARVQNDGPDRLALHSVGPLVADDGAQCRIGPRAGRWSVLRNGYQSWTGTRSFRADEAAPDPWSVLLTTPLTDIQRPSPRRRGHFRSDLYTCVTHLDTGDTLVAGFLSGTTEFSSIDVDIDGPDAGRIAARVEYDGVPLDPGAAVDLPPLWLAAGTDEQALLAAYAASAGQRMGARVPATTPLGWCSWYDYFTDISEQRIVESASALARVRVRFPCDVVQVDDGYQAAIGDWLTPNAKFPHGMRWLAGQIRSAGFDAGIWVAPFIARSGSRLLADHPDWFVRNDRGRSRFAIWNPVWGWWGRCYALDTTHPAVLAWLRRLARTLVRDWGYRFLKLDFLFAAALPGSRHDPGATRAAALRCGLEALREGAGDDAFLLGCGCPLGPAVGIVDAMRIGPDVAPFWTSLLSRTAQRGLHGIATRHAIRNALTRTPLHRRWWLNDPDCLMVRDRNTRLTADEVRTLATVVAVTDGLPMLSDRPDRLSAARLELLERALALRGGQARVTDLMRADIPELALATASERTIVAVFNFGERTQRKQVDFVRLGLRVPGALQEWWSGALIAVREGIADLGPVPPHACRVLVIKTEK